MPTYVNISGKKAWVRRILIDRSELLELSGEECPADASYTGYLRSEDETYWIVRDTRTLDTFLLLNKRYFEKA